MHEGVPESVRFAAGLAMPAPRQPKARQTFDLAGLFWLRGLATPLPNTHRMEASFRPVVAESRGYDSLADHSAVFKAKDQSLI